MDQHQMQQSVTTTPMSSATMVNVTLRQWRSKIFVFFLLDAMLGFGIFKSLQGFLCLLLCFFMKERKKEKEKKKEKKSVHLLQDTSLPHLVSLFPTPSFSVLLVGKSVTTQAPSRSSNSINTNNNNIYNKNTSNTNTNKRNLGIQSQKKFVVFNIKQKKIVFLGLNCKERKNM
jgi:hypothetical protein